VLDLYKVDNGLTKSDRKNKTKAAASLVDKGSKARVDIDESSSKIKESDVQKMSDRDYEKNQEIIHEAIKSGKFVYDISGNAR
jgi:hypothetical protein